MRGEERCRPDGEDVVNEVRRVTGRARTVRRDQRSPAELRGTELGTCVERAAEGLCVRSPGPPALSATAQVTGNYS